MRALEEALGSQIQAHKKPAWLHTLVLTLLIETHGRDRGMQRCLKNLHGIEVSLGKIASIVNEAGQRAHTWLSQQQSSTPRTLALDEQDSRWTTVPPVEIDGDRWTLLLW
jgi:hypothetical protein